MTDKIKNLQDFLAAYGTEPVLNLAVERYTSLTEENFWRWRELYRLFKEERKKPSFPLNETLDELHNVHVADDITCLAFFASEAHAAIDRVSRLKIGRYLTKFYSEHFTAEEIKTHVSHHKYTYAPPGLHVADVDPDAIEFVFENGPSSCMMRKRGYITSNLHPVRCYATDDIALLFIKKGDRITSRCIANRTTKEYVRIYGDTELAAPLLKDAGYKQRSNALEGCRLLRIPDTKEHSEGIPVLMPYVDGDNSMVKPDPDHPDLYWTLCQSASSSGGGHSAHASGGYIVTPRPRRQAPPSTSTLDAPISVAY